jgi:hypothetical protein
MAKVDRSGRRAHFARILALCVASAAAGLAVTGCRVNEDDIHRWESTAHGPDKLRAVLQHDKYDHPLRVEAALSLVRMKPRAGRRIGIGIMVDTLAVIPPETRQVIVASLVPAIITELKKPPPVAQAGQPSPPDPSFPYKDAAYAMLTLDRTVIIADEGLKQSLKQALVDWAMADFEHRLENRTQAYGMEQLLRYIGSSAVAGLPKLMTREARKLDAMSGMVAELGDPKTKEAGSSALVAIAKYVGSEEWLKIKKPEVEAANAAAKLQPTAEQFEIQILTYQGEELLRVLGSMKKIGGRPAIDHCLTIAADKGPDLGQRPALADAKADKPTKEKAAGLVALWDAKKEQGEKRRQASLAALENRLDRNSPDDIKRVLDIAKSDAPDVVLDQAFRRLGELPREAVIDKLYDLFKTDKWKVRRAAAGTALKMSTVKHIDEFLSKLSDGGVKGFAMPEALTYGASLGDLKDGNARDALTKHWNSGSPASRTSALAYWFTHGTANDLPAVQPFENDGARAPSCETDPDCKWACEIAKEGAKDPAKERENKDIKTVGEFVRFCIEPAMRERKPEAKK